MGMEALLAASVAGSTMSAIGNMTSGGAAEEAAEFNAAIERQNAVLARRRAEINASRIRRQTRRDIGTAEAIFAASGTTLDGSPLEALGDIAMEGEQDALLAEFDGQMRERFHLISAAQSIMEGKRLKRQATFRAVGDILNIGTNIYAIGSRGLQTRGPKIGNRGSAPLGTTDLRQSTIGFA